MSTALRQPMTMAEFLDWEQRQPAKHEFDGFRVVAMAGGTVRHADLQLRLETSVRYPDGTVVGKPLAGEALGASEPVVIFEVLSPSTTGSDRVAKVREYQATPSVQRYVMIEQDQVAATVLARTAEGWLSQVLAAGETLAMPEIGISVPLDELYFGTDLPEEPQQ